MGVGANHRRDPPIEVGAKRQLFTGGLGVEIHHANGDVGVFFQKTVGRAERAVDAGEKRAANQVDDRHPAKGGGVDAVSHARRLRIIVGAQQRRILVEQCAQLPTVEDVVAGCDDVDAGVFEPFCVGRQQAVANRGVFAVGHDKICAEQLAHAPQPLFQKSAACGAYDVAEK